MSKQSLLDICQNVFLVGAVLTSLYVFLTLSQ